MTAPHRTSTGLDLSGVGWLDAHYQACQPEYEAMLRAVGLQPGWRVLDAGCGPGSYLPLLGALLGPQGSIAALDLAPENIAAGRAATASAPLPCPIRWHQGDIRALPFPDGTFDAVWCAATLQYLATDDLPACLAELRRVVRPGGLVALKDYEAGHMVFGPADPSVRWHLYDALARSRGTSAAQIGTLRPRHMRTWLRAAGCVDVWQRTTLAERWFPLAPAERQYLGDYFAFLGREAPSHDIARDEVLFWQRQVDPEAPEALINQPDFYWCEGHVLAVGRVPA
jgi:SAM-dependent methyltransferase